MSVIIGRREQFHLHRNLVLHRLSIFEGVHVLIPPNIHIRIDRKDVVGNLLMKDQLCAICNMLCSIVLLCIMG